MPLPVFQDRPMLDDIKFLDDATRPEAPMSN